MFIIFNKYGLIATSKQRPIKSVRAIKSLRIDTIKMPQTTPEITIRGLYQKMIMIRRQTISRTRKFHMRAVSFRISRNSWKSS